MSHEPGTIRPRRRQRIDVADNSAVVRAERSTRILIRVPLAAADPTPTIPPAAPHKSSPASAVTHAHKTSADSTIAAKNTTIQTTQGSTSPALRHSAGSATGPDATEGSQEPVSSLPQAAKQYRRIDAAHSAAAAPHSPTPAGFERRAAALIKMFERKSLLAIGMIVAAAAIGATVMTLTNRSHQNSAEPEKIQSGNSLANPAKEANQHPSLPAPPRATSGLGLPTTQPAASNPIGKGPELTQPGTTPVNCGLPTAVLGTTLDNSAAVAHSWNAAAANSPAAISSPTNSSFADVGGTHFATANTQPPAMAEYRSPQPAVPWPNYAGTMQSGLGPTAGSVPGTAMTQPILEARRENITAVNPGNPRLGGPSASAAFDGDIGKPFEQTPR